MAKSIWTPLHGDDSGSLESRTDLPVGKINCDLIWFQSLSDVEAAVGFFSWSDTSEQEVSLVVPLLVRPTHLQLELQLSHENHGERRLRFFKTLHKLNLDTHETHILRFMDEISAA